MDLQDLQRNLASQNSNDPRRAPFKPDTSYKAEFGEKKLPAQRVEDQGLYSSSIISKFVKKIGNTSYADQYKTPAVSELNKHFEIAANQQSEASHPSHREINRTTFQDDFRGLPGAKPESVEPLSKLPVDKFATKTTYNQNFNGETNPNALQG